MTSKKIYIILITVFLTLLNSNSVMAKETNYKLKVVNAWGFPLKVTWFCNGKKKDKDTFPIGGKTRELYHGKCKDIKDLSVRFALKHSSGQFKLNAYMHPDAYVNPLPDFKNGDMSRGLIRFLKSFSNRNMKAIYKAGYLYEIKFDEINGAGNKRCVVVSKDVVMMNSVEQWIGIPMPAVYPNQGCKFIR
jgi:hypothetical protein